MQGLKIVILTNVFTLEESQQEENYFKDLEFDIKEECQAKLGPIMRMKIFENNPMGVILIKFRNSGAAEECIKVIFFIFQRIFHCFDFEKLMNGRYFSGRRLECFYYDGKTNYDRKVSLEEEEKRIGWDFLVFFLTIKFSILYNAFFVFALSQRNSGDGWRGKSEKKVNKLISEKDFLSILINNLREIKFFDYSFIYCHQFI